jgi:hypothetical protein
MPGDGTIKVRSLVTGDELALPVDQALAAIRAGDAELAPAGVTGRPAETTVIDRETNEAVRVPVDIARRGVEEGRYRFTEGAKISVASSEGELGVIPAEQLEEAVEEEDYRPATREEEAFQRDIAIQKRARGARTVTLAENIASGATLGGFDVLRGESPEALARRAAYPKTAMIGEIAGVVAPTVLTLGAAGPVSTAARLTPAGMLGRGGAAIAGRGAGRGLAARVGYGGAAGALEGAGIGAGAGVSELALSPDPITAERAVSVIGSHALYGAKFGAGIGAGIPLVGAAVGAGLRRAKKFTERMGRGRAVEGAAGDLTTLDRAGLRAAETAEHETLAAAQIAEKAAITDDIVGGRQLFDDVNPWIATENAGIKARLNKAKRQYRNQLDTPDIARKNPNRLEKALHIENEALREIATEATSVLEKAAAADAKIIRELTEELSTLPRGAKGLLSTKASRRYGDWVGQKPPKAGFALGEEKLLGFRKAMKAGEIAGARRTSLSRIGELVEMNEGFITRIEAVYKKPTSARLEQIAAARDALTTGGQGGIVGQVLGLVPGSGMLKKLGSMVTGPLAKAGQGAVARTGSAIDAATTAGAKAAKYARPTATAVLERVAYAPAGARGVQPRAAIAPATKLHAAYQEREAELLAVTEPGPTGAPVVKPRARRQIAERLEPIQVTNPLLADHMESIAVRRLEYLASKIPKRPSIMALQPGPDPWRPSDMQLASFARTVAAVEDPGSVFERAVDGSVTPEDAEALRMAWPEIFEEARTETMMRLADLQKSLPYERRLSLSILYGVPLDPSLDPRVLTILQGHFADEPGTQGGVTPPLAQPQFASVSKPEPTPAQERSAGGEPL